MERVLEEPVKVLFHLNGYTKILLERTEGVGLADGGISWEIPTEKIPNHLRKIGSRFILRHKVPNFDEESNIKLFREVVKTFEIIDIN